MPTVDEFQIIDFDARITIRCVCGGRVTIGPNSIAGNCWGCGRHYMTAVQVEDRGIRDE